MRRWPYVALLLGFWAFQTGAQARLWCDPLALWMTARLEAPAKPRPWSHLGAEYLYLGRPDLAEQCWRQTLTRAVARPPQERFAATQNATWSLGRLNLDVVTWLASE